MSFEQIKIISEAEEAKSFEELEYTRSFGPVGDFDAKKIIKENLEYWRLPTLSEFYALRKQNKIAFLIKKAIGVRLLLTKVFLGTL